MYLEFYSGIIGVVRIRVLSTRSTHSALRSDHSDHMDFELIVSSADNWRRGRLLDTIKIETLEPSPCANLRWVDYNLAFSWAFIKRSCHVLTAS